MFAYANCFLTDFRSPMGTHPLHLGAERTVADLQDAVDEFVGNALLFDFQAGLLQCTKRE